MTDIDALRASLGGKVSAAGDPGWDIARQSFNLGLDQRPALVAVSADANDVARVVRFASQRGLRVAAQATGHGASPLGDLGGTILLKTSAMTGVQVDAGPRRARAAGGARWQDVVTGASELGLAALHGSSGTVGVAGYSLGGGISWYVRKLGLQANSVTAVELVTADGQLVRADHEREPELFWALRGGGGNFGVVTALEFALYPADVVYAGALFFPFERAAEVLHALSGLECLAGRAIPARRDQPTPRHRQPVPATLTPRKDGLTSDHTVPQRTAGPVQEMDGLS